MSTDWRISLMAAMAGAVATALSITPAFAAGDIGRVKIVISSAYGTPPAESRQKLYTRDDVFSNEVVETGNKSALHIAFIDQTNFRLGSKSRATLDRFIYDPDSKTGELILILKEGIFRIKTGKMKKEGIRVVTPVAIITVTGTDFIVQVLADLIRVSVLEGSVNISPTTAGAAPISLVAPGTGELGRNRPFLRNTGPPESHPGLDDDAGAEGSDFGGGDGGGD